MKHLILFAGLSSLSVLAAAQQKDIFDIDRHLQGNKKFQVSPQTTYSLPPLAVHSNRMSLQYRLPNADGIYSQQSYRMPVIVPETTLDQIPNPGLSQRLKTVILSWPRESISGNIPNNAPVISW